MHEVPELRSSPATSAQHTHAALAASRDMGTWTGTPDLPNQSRAFLSMEEEIHQQWAFPVFSRRKKELDDNVPEQIFFFFLHFLKLLRPVVIHSFSVYPSLARSLENDKMGDRRHQEQQSVQSLCDYSSQSQSAMAKLPAHA